MRSTGPNFQIFPLKEYFTPELDASGPESSHPRFFTHFGRPRAKSFESVFFTCVQQNRWSIFEMWPTGLNFQIFPLGRVFRSGTWRQWSRKFPSRIFYAFWPHHGRKFQFAWDPFWGATNWVKFPNFSSFSLQNFTPVDPKVSLQDFLRILAAHNRKFRSGLFDQCANKLVKFPNFSPRESILLGNLTPVVSKVSLQDFLLILAAHGRKFRFGLFDRRATIIWVRSFWPFCDYNPISVLSTNGGTNGG